MRTSGSTSSGRSRSGGTRIGHDVEPVEEVLAEAAGLHLGGEVAVGRRDEAHVDGLGPPADLLHLARLQRAQDLGLDGQRQLANLVDEERALVGLLEVALRAPAARR